MMIIKTVNCPVYATIASVTDNYLYTLGYDDRDIERYRREWSWSTYKFKLSVAEAEEKEEEEEKRFFQWIETIVKGEYYQFIITNEQKACFLQDIAKTGFAKYLIYTSSRPSYNCNMPEEDPRLWVYLFHVKES